MSQYDDIHRSASAGMYYYFRNTIVNMAFLDELEDIIDERMWIWQLSSCLELWLNPLHDI